MERAAIFAALAVGPLRQAVHRVVRHLWSAVLQSLLSNGLGAGRELLGIGENVAIAVSLKGHLHGGDLGDHEGVWFIIRTVKGWPCRKVGR